MVKAAPEQADRSQRIGDLSSARTMLLAIACLIATVAAGPVTYDQRQDGSLNAQVDISNILFIFALPKKIGSFDIFSKNNKPGNSENSIQDRSDVRVMEAFVKPNTPYRVEIGSNEKSDEGDERVAEILIAGRRRLESDQLDSQEQDELKLLGATENCGPDRIRDSVTLMCKDKPVEKNAIPETVKEQKEESSIKSTPEVVQS